MYCKVYVVIEHFIFFETSEAFPQTSITQFIRNGQELKDVYLPLTLLDRHGSQVYKECSCRKFQKSQANELCS